MDYVFKSANGNGVMLASHKITPTCLIELSFVNVIYCVMENTHKELIWPFSQYQSMFFINVITLIMAKWPN